MNHEEAKYTKEEGRRKKILLLFLAIRFTFLNLSASLPEITVT
jgi:hypothetical protein